jgi:hypothetical protein
MIKTKRALIALCCLPLFLGLSGCNLFGGTPEKDPQVVLKEMIKNASTVKSADFILTPSMKVKSPEGNFNFNIDLSGKFDKNDIQSPKYDFNLDLSMKMEDPNFKDEGMLNLAFMFIKDKGYVKINDLRIPASIQMFVAQYLDLVNEYKAKWIELKSDSLPETVQNQLIAEETAEEKQIRELAEKTEFFEVLKNYGAENLNGANVYHYDVTLNKENFKIFAKETAKINGEELSTTELSDMDETLEKLTMTMGLWIGVLDSLPYKVDLTANAKEEKQNLEFEIILTGNINKYNTDQQIVAPAPTTNIDEIMQKIEAAASNMMAPGVVPPGLEMDEGSIPSERMDAPTENIDIPNLPEMPDLDSLSPDTMPSLEGLEGMDVEELESQLNKLQEDLDKIEVETE